MNSLVLNDLFTMTVYTLCQAIVIYLLFRDCFRVDIVKALLLWLITSLVSTGIGIYYYLGGSISWDIYIDIGFGLIRESILLVLFRENRFNRYLLYTTWEYLTNMIQTTLLAVYMSIFGIINGELPWYVKDEAGISMFIINLIVTVLGAVLSFRIMKYFRNDIENLHGKRRIAILIMMLVQALVMLIIKPLVTDPYSYRNNPGGAGMICDMITVGLFFVTFIWIICIHVKKIRYERRKITESVEADLLMYEKTEQLQQEVREASHEINNLKQIGQEGSRQV